MFYMNYCILKREAQVLVLGNHLTDLFIAQGRLDICTGHKPLPPCLHLNDPSFPSLQTSFMDDPYADLPEPCLLFPVSFSLWIVEAQVDFALTS